MDQDETPKTCVLRGEKGVSANYLHEAGYLFIGLRLWSLATSACMSDANSPVDYLPQQICPYLRIFPASVHCERAPVRVKSINSCYLRIEERENHSFEDAHC